MIKIVTKRQIEGFRPSSLAIYNALSNRFKKVFNRSFILIDVISILIVIVPTFSKQCVAISLRICSLKTKVLSEVVSGSNIINSSPPQQAKKSVSRTCNRTYRAKLSKTISPILLKNRQSCFCCKKFEGYSSYK